MSERAFTSGPWHIVPETLGNVEDESGKAVAMAQQTHPRKHGERMANARLIAAARDLLAACEGLMADDYQRAIEAIWGTGPAECKWAFDLVHERNSAARAALAKAGAAK